MTRRDLEETCSSASEPSISAQYPAGYSKCWIGSGTVSEPASGRAGFITELGASAMQVAQSRHDSFYFQVEGHNFRADPSGTIEQGHGGTGLERRREIYQLLTEGSLEE